MQPLSEKEITDKWADLKRKSPTILNPERAVRLARWVESRLREGRGLKNQSGATERVFTVSSGYGANTQKPFVALEFDGQMLDQIPPEGARALAYNLIAAAEAAEQDAFLVTFMQKQVGLPLTHAAQVLGEYRQWRSGDEPQV